MKVHIEVTTSRQLNLSGDFVCLHQVAQGSARVVTARTTHTLVGDGFLIINSGAPHLIHADRHPVLTIAIDPSLLPTGRFEECLTPRDFNLDRAVSRLLDSVRRHDQVGAETWKGQLITSIIKAREGTVQEYFLSESATRHDHVKRAMIAAREFIISNLGSPLTLGRVAWSAALSEFHFHRVFTEWHQMTPSKYILEERMRRACRQLIVEADPVQAIAENCGYSSSTSFVRAFRQCTGMSPSEFRLRRRHLRSEVNNLYQSLQSC